MHGEIGVESQPGRGSTFWFTAHFEKQSGRPSPHKVADLEGIKVLIVDDNATNRKILQLQLESFDMRPTAVATGSEALETLRKAVDAGDPYALAILDLQMPEMDGPALARAIKSEPAIAPTHLVVLSSVGQGALASEHASAGIEEFLVKPVKQSRLQICLATLMGRVKTPRHTGTPLVATPQHLARILLAEDHKINRKVALMQLRRLGYNADAVANGNEALEALRQNPYDIVLMDCQMPELDGYETTTRIRQQFPPSIHIIAMTANAMQGDREKCLAIGMDDYLTKPVRIADLEAALLRWQNKQDASAAMATRDEGMGS